MYDTSEELRGLIRAIYEPETPLTVDLTASVARIRSFLRDEDMPSEERRLFLNLLAQQFEEICEALEGNIASTMPLAETEQCPSGSDTPLMLDLETIVMIARAEVLYALKEAEE